MKKTRFLLLATALVLMLTMSFVACTSTGDDATDGDTASETNAPETTPETAPESETEPATVAETEPATELTTEPATEAEETETGDVEPGEVESMDLFAPEIRIGTVEDLIKFNQFVNYELDESVYPSDWYGIDEQTVILTADIDLEGYEWVPLDGESLIEVVFDGQGHTIKNMTINYNTDRTVSEGANYGCGFVGKVPASSYVTFQNITFEDAYITARERHIGCVVGRNDGNSTFENVTIKNFTVDGWCDIIHDSEATGGYPITFRVGGIVGATFAGYLDFTNCTVDGMLASGFHNLAGILGCDNVTGGSVTGYSFEGCHVENVKLVFSYCLSASYTVDMPRKYVSVFFNEAGNKWVDTVEDCLDNGNTYANVTYYDWTSTEEYDENGSKDINAMDEYDAGQFRSWTQEEADAA